MSSVSQPVYEELALDGRLRLGYRGVLRRITGVDPREWTLETADEHLSRLVSFAARQDAGGIVFDWLALCRGLRIIDSVLGNPISTSVEVCRRVATIEDVCLPIIADATPRLGASTQRTALSDFYYGPSLVVPGNALRIEMIKDILRERVFSTVWYMWSMTQAELPVTKEVLRQGIEVSELVTGTDYDPYDDTTPTGGDDDTVESDPVRDDEPSYEAPRPLSFMERILGRGAPPVPVEDDQPPPPPILLESPGQQHETSVRRRRGVVGSD